MIRERLLLTVGGLLAALSLGSLLAEADDAAKGGAPVKESPGLLDPRAWRIGHQIPDLSFTDLKGRAGKLSSFKGAKAVVVLFRDTGCPLSKKFAPRTAALEAIYGAKSVAFLYINPSPSATAEAMKKECERYGFKGRYAHDPKGLFGTALKANRTTDVFVLDAARTLVYRGAISDQYGLGYTRAKPRRRYLVEALDSVIEGRLLRDAATSAPGCSLSFKASKPVSGAPTFHGRISRIIQRSCQECHRDGEAAPFPLVTYKNVVGYKGMIKRVVTDRLMPPWFASGKSGHWRNDRSLSTEDRGALLAWIDAGCPKGDIADAPVALHWTPGWSRGTPDKILRLPRPVSVPAEGVVDYIYMRVPTKFAEDRWIKAFDIRPTAPEVVHHVLVFIKYPKDHPRAKEQPKFRGGTRGYFAGAVPGQGAFVCPPNTAKFLPKGSTLIFQMHYTPNGAAVRDQTRLGIYFAKKRPLHEFKTIGIAETKLRIPPMAPSHMVKKTRRFRSAMRIYGFNPHMHLRGKAFKYELLLPNGETRILLDVPRYDFNWQLTYWLREPVDIPAGSRIRVTGWFDNSDKNPANPDPRRTVPFGEQTSDEMLIGYVNGHKLP